MSIFLQILLAVSAVIVVAEGLNKLDRVDPRAKEQSTRERVCTWLKAVAWFFLVLGAGIYLIALAFGDDARGELARLAAPLVLIGFATLIVRTRVKEG